ncbi:hypothetical protein ACFQZZ_13180 [Nocardia sp. GCM10030253]|uniref:hypothetical protein n=1 Tax=Nocardia sp. GCM10030253 TaxID=3273404 RepID=UPI003631CE27
MSPGQQRDPIIEQLWRMAEMLAVPQPWTLAAFIERAEGVTGKRIRLLPAPGLVAEGAPCGLVLERAAEIVVAYDAMASDADVSHIVRHEVGHLLLNQIGRAPDRSMAEALDTVFPGLDPDEVLHALGPHDRGDERQCRCSGSSR